MSQFDTDIENCLEVLAQGGTILYPTDTIWGIGCDATNEEAVQKIFSIKQRDPEKSMIILVADERDILQYVADPPPAALEYIRTAAKPTTVIYDGALGLAPSVSNRNGTVAIRVVQEKFCRHLIKRFRRPIVSTSANFSGSPAPRNFKEIVNDMRTAVDYVVAYRQNDDSVADPSAVIRWNRDGSTTVIRA